VEIISKIGLAGNQGTDVRSDCYVTFELKETGGIKINLKSKVEVMYQEANLELCNKILNHFQIENCELSIDDKGAIDCVLAARIEAAIKKVILTDKEYFSELIEENKYSTKKEQFRFSRLYLPGNTPKLALNAGIHYPNGIILDLEDAVAPDKKFEARFLVRNMLRTINFYGAERMVRINQLPLGLEDLKYIVPHNVNLILLPKCESASQIKQLEEEISKLHKFNNNPIYFMPIIESALGVENAFEIATSSSNVVALAIGLEDYTADMGVRRTNEGNESLYARTRLVNACKAAKIQPIDSVFSDISDMDALAVNVKNSKSLGFEGMGCIHPRQIKVIHDNFAPENDELEKAKKIVNAFYVAQDLGLGVVSLGSKMIDAPVVKRAEKLIKLAVDLKLIPENWREEFN
jgi:citrate lyase subunit beta/citryl-CoA lyase